MQGEKNRSCFEREWYVTYVFDREWFVLHCNRNHWTLESMETAIGFVGKNAHHGLDRIWVLSRSSCGISQPAVESPEPPNNIKTKELSMKL